MSGWFYMIFIDIILCSMRHDQVDLQKPVKSIPQLSSWLFIPLGWSQNPTGEGAIRVRQVGISVLLKSSQICSVQCCSSTGHVTYGHHIWSVHTAWYVYIYYYGIHMVFHICILIYIYSITCLGAASWSAIHPRSRWFYPALWHRMAREATRP